LGGGQAEVQRIGIRTRKNADKRHSCDGP
jgi:hypothetical protein